MSFRLWRASWLLSASLVLAPVAALTSAPALAQTAASDAPAVATEEHPQHVPASEAGEDFEEYVEGASRLEGRIIAPCCWNQTIDIHGSEAAYELRREIRRRLKAGETPDVIEASLVQRFGPKILAVPNSSPLSSLATILALGFGAAGVGAYFMLKHWTKAGAAAAKASGPTKPAKGGGGSASPKRDALDDRLDQELSEIEHQA